MNKKLLLLLSISFASNIMPMQDDSNHIALEDNIAQQTTLAACHDVHEYEIENIMHRYKNEPESILDMMKLVKGAPRYQMYLTAAQRMGFLDDNGQEIKRDQNIKSQTQGLPATILNYIDLELENQIKPMMDFYADKPQNLLEVIQKLNEALIWDEKNQFGPVYEARRKQLGILKIAGQRLGILDDNCLPIVENQKVSELEFEVTRITPSYQNNPERLLKSIAYARQNSDPDDITAQAYIVLAQRMGLIDEYGALIEKENKLPEIQNSNLSETLKNTNINDHSDKNDTESEGYESYCSGPEDFFEYIDFESEKESVKDCKQPDGVELEIQAIITWYMTDPTTNLEQLLYCAKLTDPSFKDFKRAAQRLGLINENGQSKKRSLETAGLTRQTNPFWAPVESAETKKQYSVKDYFDLVAELTSPNNALISTETYNEIIKKKYAPGTLRRDAYDEAVRRVGTQSTKN